LDPLTETAGKLPLLDKAQLYVLVTYAVESILFSYLRLNGVNAREHPVFRELSRVKQYFEKISAAEVHGNKISPNAQLDKAAADRFIRHALGNHGNPGKRLAKELEDRKLVLQQRLALQKTKLPQGQIVAAHRDDQELAAGNKAGALTGKRKYAAVSDDNKNTKNPSTSVDTETGLVRNINAPRTANTITASRLGTRPDSESDPTKINKDGKRARK